MMPGSEPGIENRGLDNQAKLCHGRGKDKEIAAMLEGFVNTSVLLKPGVYALLREGVVVYIGQSKKPLSRIEAHRSLWGRTQRNKAPGWLPIKAILFDEVHVLPCRVEDLDLVERAMIDLYKPKYNMKLKSPHPVSTEFNINVGGFTIPFNIAQPVHAPLVRRF